MKRLVTLAALLAAVVTMATLATPAVYAASCSPARIGGEQQPTLRSDGVTLDELSAGGYNCTVAWHSLVTLQYETGGVFVTATELAPRRHPASTNFTSLVDHTWQDNGWVPTGSADTPACSVNWRFHVDIYNANDVEIASAVSPELHKTC